jgi:hypothetical protein
MKMDKETQIESRYSTCILTWSFGQFRKTFPTPVSGLPDLLFNEGYCAFKTFYQRTVTMNTNNDSNIIPYDDEELIGLEDSDDTISMLFMLHESILLNDSKGTTSEVTYLGSDKVLQHKVGNKNSTSSLLMAPCNLQWILLISVLSLYSLSSMQLNFQKTNLSNVAKISNPEILDNDQRELMDLHCKLNHLPFPTMISLAEKGKLNKKFVKLKHRVPVCISCLFGMCHQKPWRSKCSKGSIRKETDDALGKHKHGSNGLRPSRINSSNGGLFNKSAHLECNNLCRSLLKLHICGSHA